ncbi:MAG: hypothetical protein QW818_03790, partial [Candidatus Aenigmatarchaeota archaeon]
SLEPRVISGSLGCRLQAASYRYYSPRGLSVVEGRLFCHPEDRASGTKDLLTISPRLIAASCKPLATIKL